MARLLMMALLAVGVGGVAACQVYDFQKVSPLALAQTTQGEDVVAKQLRPNMMILVDRSGSMDVAVDRNNPTGPSRITVLKQVMNSFLTNSGNVARMGLAFFPEPGAQCKPTSTVSQDLLAPSLTDDDNANRQQAGRINQAVQAANVGGGTPTGSSLLFVGNLPSLNDDSDLRQDFVLLLTDGLPNCNEQNVNHTCGRSNQACLCTLGSGRLADCMGAPAGGITPCSQGCLDRSGVVEKIQALRAKNIKVIVVGFGSDTADGNAPDTLNAMAEAGGFARECKSGMDSECGAGNSCIAATGLCQRKFYQASTGAELSRALISITDRISRPNPCVFDLEAQPSDPRFLAVIVDGQNQTPGPDSWSYTGGTVTFVGPTCTRLENATPASPVNVQIRILQQL